MVSRMGQTVCCNHQRERSTPMDTLDAGKMDGSARNSTPGQVSRVSPDYGYCILGQLIAVRARCVATWAGRVLVARRRDCDSSWLAFDTVPVRASAGGYTAALGAISIAYVSLVCVLASFSWCDGFAANPVIQDGS